MGSDPGRRRRRGMTVSYGELIEGQILSGPMDEFSTYWASTPWRKRYGGLNTRAMIVTPSEIVYDLFLKTARDSLYVPYTQSEQDVIESLISTGEFKLTSTRVEQLPLVHQKGIEHIPWIRQVAS